MKNYKICYFIVFVIILLDQSSKLLVHFNMKMGYLGEIEIFGKWLKLHYTLNPGMAFGIRVGTKYGKLFLTSFRLLATYLIAYQLPKLVKKDNTSSFIILGWTFILGGAIGNIIDCIFYGVILNNAPPSSPMNLFYGQVIDMILVGIENIYIPSFVPFIGARYLPPFPVFNLADSFICIGVTLIIFDGINRSLKPLQRLKKIKERFYKKNKNNEDL